MRGRRRGLSHYFVRCIYTLLAGVIILGGPFMARAAAVQCANGLPQLDCLALLNDSTVWLPDVCGAISSGDSSLSGDGAAQQIFNYFFTRGYTADQAAGIVGNTSAESANQPERLQGTSAGTLTPYDTIPAGSNLGWGIVQWTPASKVGDFVKGNGLDPNQLATQLHYLYQQLEGTSPVHSEQAAGDALKAVTTGVTTDDGIHHDTAWHAAQVFLQYYERAADHNPNGANAKVRGGLADSALAAFGSSTVPIPADSNQGCNDTTAVGTTGQCNTTAPSGGYNAIKQALLAKYRVNFTGYVDASAAAQTFVTLCTMAASPTFYSKLIPVGHVLTIDLQYDKNLACGGWNGGPGGDPNLLVLYAPICGGKINNRYLLGHELGHHYAHWNPSVYQAFLKGPYAKSPHSLPDWNCQIHNLNGGSAFTGDQQNECFASALGEYLVWSAGFHMALPFPNGQPQLPSGYKDYKTGDPEWYNFVKDNVFGGVEYTSVTF